MHEALFRESDDPIKLQVFAERIEPYLDNPFYKVVIIILILRDEIISLLLKFFTHSLTESRNILSLILEKQL